MGSHRAADSGLGRSASGSSGTPGRRIATQATHAAPAAVSSTPSTYVGKRVARPAVEATPIDATPIEIAPVEVAPLVVAPLEAAPVAPAAPVAVAEATLPEITLDTPPAARAAEVVTRPLPRRDEAAAASTLEIFRGIGDDVVIAATVATTPVESHAAVHAAVASAAGKRRAARHTGRRGPLFKGIPSGPVLAGIATMAVAVGGALTSGVSSDLINTVSDSSHVVQASALSGAAGQSATSLIGRSPGVSRDSGRDAQSDAAETPLEKQTEAQAKQHDAALADFAEQAQEQSDKIALNLWVLPVDGYHITNTFGVARSYYSSGYHTGLDFAAPYGTAIHAIADGVVTSASYDGAYGNKTVVTLDDGTEIWFCHQSSFAVGAGDTVSAGETIGYIGETGNAYGAHLHIEVHPGGGDAVDPFPAFIQHGVSP